MNRIVHIAFSDDKGGAAIAAYRLHKAMLEYGLDSKMIVFEKYREDSEISTIYNNYLEGLCYKIKTYLFSDRGFVKEKGKGYFTKYNIGSFIKHNNIIKNADIIILHWISRGMISINNIVYLLNTEKQVYWVMHDMYPFTGGCHHSYDCTKYENDCDLCMYKTACGKRSQKNLVKKEILKNYKNMHWIAPSNWLYKKASHSIVINPSNLYCIPNVISSNFFVLDKIESRKKIGLSIENKYILFGADGVLANPYKGLDLFVKMLNKMLENNINSNDCVSVIIFGSDDNKELIAKIPFPVYFAGVVRDEETMNLLYNSADVFVSCSMAENYPLTIQESTFCRTPVVAFDVGGIKDIIDSPSKGVLIQDFNIDIMADCVFDVLFRWGYKDNSVSSEKFRESIVNEYRSLFKYDN